MDREEFIMSMTGVLVMAEVFEGDKDSCMSISASLADHWDEIRALVILNGAAAEFNSVQAIAFYCSIHFEDALDVNYALEGLKGTAFFNPINTEA